MAECRKCGAPLGDNDRFCQRCGTKVESDPAPERAPWEASLTPFASAPEAPQAPESRGSHADDSWTGYAHGDSDYAYAAAPQSVGPAPVRKKHKALTVVLIILAVLGGIAALFGAFCVGVGVGSNLFSDSLYSDIYGDSSYIDHDDMLEDLLDDDTQVPDELDSAASSLIDSYFTAAQQGDTDAVLALLHPETLDAQNIIYGEDYALAHIDNCTGSYGAEITDYSVTSIDSSYTSYPVIESEDNINYSDADLDVSVTVDYANGDEYIIDFDLVEEDGLWYIVSIW